MMADKSTLYLDSGQQLLDQVWREWEYRHSRFWTTYYRAAFAMGMFLALPFLGQPYVDGTLRIGQGPPFSAQFLLLFFPMAAALVASTAHHVLKTEYARFKQVNAAYKELVQISIDQWGLRQRYDQPSEVSHIPDLMNRSLLLAFIMIVAEGMALLSFTPSG